MPLFVDITAYQLPATVVVSANNFDHKEHECNKLDEMSLLNLVFTILHEIQQYNFQSSK